MNTTKSNPAIVDAYIRLMRVGTTPVQARDFIVEYQEDFSPPIQRAIFYVPVPNAFPFDNSSTVKWLSAIFKLCRREQERPD
jgi:hypothetical protein